MRCISFLILIISSFSINAQSVDFEWADRFRGNGNEFSNGIAIDNSGNTYIAGHFNGNVDFDPSLDTLWVTAIGNRDLFILKLDSLGDLLWVKTIGVNARSQAAQAIAVDSIGNCYVTGEFEGAVDFDPGIDTSQISVLNGSRNMFVLKLDSSGVFQWAKAMGGSPYVIYSNSIDIDDSGNVYTTGSFKGTVDLDPGTGVANLSAAGINYTDVFILKLDSLGDYVWAKKIGGIDRDVGHSIVVNKLGDVFTTGYFKSTVDFDPGGGTTNISSTGSRDAFVLKLNALGNYDWAIKLGGSDWEEAYSIELDEIGNIYVSGYFAGVADFDPSIGTLNITSAGLADAFVTKLNNQGGVEWAKGMGGASADYGNSVTVDQLGNVYALGTFQDPANFDPGVSDTNLTAIGGMDVFVSKFDSVGNFVWVKQIGGGGSCDGEQIILDDYGNIYTTGSFVLNIDFDPGPAVTSYAGISNDAFVTKWGQSCSLDTSVVILNDTLFSNASNATYQWLDCNNNNVAIPGATSQSYSTPLNGNYAVVITQGSCIDTSSCMEMIILGDKEFELHKDYTIYPNPTSGTIFIQLKKGFKETFIEVVNMLGEVIHTEEVKGDSYSYDIAAKGVYLLKITSNSNTNIEKIIYR